MTTVRRMITIITVVLLFTASLAESSICFICSLVVCPTECEIAEQIECEPITISCCAEQAMVACQQAEPVLQVGPLRPSEPIFKSYPCSPAPFDCDYDFDTEIDQRICVINYTTKPQFKHKCDDYWQPPLLTSVLFENNLFPREQTELIDSDSDRDRSNDPGFIHIVNSRPRGVHNSILTTVVRC